MAIKTKEMNIPTDAGAKAAADATKDARIIDFTMVVLF